MIKTILTILILLYAKNGSVRIVKVDMQRTLYGMDTTKKDSLTITISKK